MRQFTRWSLMAAVAGVLVAAQFITAAEPTEQEKAKQEQPDPSEKPRKGDASSDETPATAPTTRPDRGRSFERVWGGGRERGGFMQGRPPESYRDEELPSEEDWQEMVEFMKANSPVRLEMYEKLAAAFGNEHQRTQFARRRIAGRYRELEAMKSRHSEMYEFGLKQAQLEDRILGTLRELRTVTDEDPIRAKLRGLVGDYVENFMDEREARLKHLREMVERETQKIKDDRESIDKLVDRQLEKFQNEMGRLIEFSEDPEGWRKRNTPSP